MKASCVLRTMKASCVLRTMKASCVLRMKASCRLSLVCTSAVGMLGKNPIHQNHVVNSNTQLLQPPSVKTSLLWMRAVSQTKTTDIEHLKNAGKEENVTTWHKSFLELQAALFADKEELSASRQQVPVSPALSPR